MAYQAQRSLNLLYPPFLSQVVSCIDKANTLGLNVFCFETYRGPDRQQMLYSQTPKVTNSKAWESWHQFGLAIDLAFGGPGKWTWSGDTEAVEKVFIEGGLRWIGPKDPLHFEYDHSLTLEAARKIMTDGSILSVWLEIEQMKKGEIN